MTTGGKNTRARRGQSAALPREQADLFDRPAGIWCGYSSDYEFRQALGDAIAASGMSREEIAQQMERLLGSHPDYPVSKVNLDTWTAPSRTEWRMPAIYLLAFIQVTGASAFIRRAAHALGYNVHGHDDKIAAEYGKLIAEEKAIAQRKRALEKQLGVR